MLNWPDGNESSSLVSEMSGMATLFSIINERESDLFLIELIFKWAIIKFFGNWIFIFLSPIFALIMTESTETFLVTCTWLSKALSLGSQNLAFQRLFESTV